MHNSKMGFPQVMRVFLLLFLHVLLVNCSSESEVVTIDVSQAKDLLDSGYAFLDVRTVEEYKEGHVAAEKIFNVPYWFFTPEGREKNTNFLEEVLSVCKQTDRLVVGCKCGVRSLHAANDLLAAGFKNVSNMEAGYADWVAKGFPVKVEQQHPHNEL